MASGDKRSPAHKGIPYDQLVEAQGQYDVVTLKVSRVNQRGTRTSMGSFDKTIDETSNIDVWLKEACGGGRFHVDPRHGMQRADPIPHFEFEIDGPPRALKASEVDAAPRATGPMGVPGMMGMGAMPAMMGNAAMQMGLGGAPAPGAYVDPKHLPPFVRGMAQEQQMAWAMANAPGAIRASVGQAPQNAFASDEIANKELDRAKQELAAERARREAERKELTARLDRIEQVRLKDAEAARERERQLEKQRDADARQAEQQQFQMQLEQMRQNSDAQIAALKASLEKHPEPAKPMFSPEMITAVGGIVTAFVSSNQERSQQMMQMQAQGQQELLRATMQKADNKPLMDVLKLAMPGLIPLFTSMWEAKSPQAQSNLVATMAENQLTSISMMAELINSFGAGQENPPYWLPMAQQALAGVVQAAEAVANKNKEVAGALPADRSQAPVPAPAAQPQPQVHQGQVADPPPPVPTAEDPFPVDPVLARQYAPLMSLPAAQLANMIMESEGYPEYARGRDWHQALVLLHQKSSVAARHIANMFRRMDDQGTTPPELERVWEAADVELARILAPMPIWHVDNAYARGVIDGIIGYLQTKSGYDEDAQGNPIIDTDAEGGSGDAPPPIMTTEPPVDAQTMAAPEPKPDTAATG